MKFLPCGCESLSGNVHRTDCQFAYEQNKLMKTHSELINCVRRELSMRIAIYPRRVADGKMPQEKADHEIESMRQVLEILEKHNPQTQLPLA